MGYTMTSPLTMIAFACVLILVAYLVRLNRAMTQTPPEAMKYWKGPLTLEEVKTTYDKVVKNGIDWNKYVPPQLDRRYIVVGGSGLVGRTIVLQLLQRGTPPEAIRIIDAREPSSDASVISQVPFIKADITSEAAVLEAFQSPWSAPIASLPLTVFHTAAVILPAERSAVVYHRCGRVNVGGTANVVSAARAAGAGLLIYTSSSIVGSRPVGWFSGAPWKCQPDNYMQILTEDETGTEKVTNYARSKTEAERLVCGGDDKEGMRTGAIRPGMAVFGSLDDFFLGRMLAQKGSATFSAPWVQSYVHAGNVAIAHLQYEAALLGPHVDKVAARPFIVTNHGPPVMFQDVYFLFDNMSVTGYKVVYPPPVLLLLLAYAVELYDVALARFPVLQRVLSPPQRPLSLLQPGTFSSSVTYIIDDSLARRRPEYGGIGYDSACTTVEGMCAVIQEWNQLVAEKKDA